MSAPDSDERTLAQSICLYSERVFDRFHARFQLSSRASHPGALVDQRQAVRGYNELMSQGGPSFNGGLYFLHDRFTKDQADALVSEAFPELCGRIDCFGRDWLGRQFSLDASRVASGEPLVLLIEPGTGEALEIDATFEQFHNHELVDEPDAALALAFFHDWIAAQAPELPLGAQECVGYRVPLFLGGADDVSNLERSELDVYWSLCGQLRAQAVQLPPGTPVHEVSTDTDSAN